MKKTRVLIVEIKGYIGDDTSLIIEPNNKMYLIVKADTGEVLDYGYRTYKEIRETIDRVKKFYELVNKKEIK